MKRSLFGLVLAATLPLTPGCKSTQRQPAGPLVQPPRPVFPGGAPAMQPAAAPPAGFPTAPLAVQPLAVQPLAVQPLAVQPLAVQPPAAQPPQTPQGNLSPFPTIPPAPSPSGGGLPPMDSGSRSDYRWQSAETRVELLPPEPVGEQRGASEPGAARITNPPSAESDRPAQKPSTAMPVGIPRFCSVEDNVAAGLRPSLDDGLDWLAAKGYRTILQVRSPGEPDSADRKQVEKRGMKYVSLEVSPQTLTKTLADEFSRLVRSPSNQPLFVYDRDGALAGSLWYLHFRTAHDLPEDAARIRAASLGLREDQPGLQRDMWQAVQKVLAEK